MQHVKCLSPTILKTSGKFMAYCFVLSAKSFFITTTTSKPRRLACSNLNDSRTKRFNLFLATASLTFLFATTTPSLACISTPKPTNTEKKGVFFTYRWLEKTLLKLSLSVSRRSTENDWLFMLKSSFYPCFF